MTGFAVVFLWVLLSCNKYCERNAFLKPNFAISPLQLQIPIFHCGPQLRAMALETPKICDELLTLVNYSW